MAMAYCYSHSLQIANGIACKWRQKQWRNQGRGPPLIFRPNWGPKGRKKFFWRPTPRRCLKIWIRNWKVIQITTLNANYDDHTDTLPPYSPLLFYGSFGELSFTCTWSTILVYELYEFSNRFHGWVFRVHIWLTYTTKLSSQDFIQSKNDSITLQSLFQSLFVNFWMIFRMFLMCKI